MNKEIMITVKTNRNNEVQINVLRLPVLILVIILMSACAPSTTQIADQAANVANGTDIPNAADSATATFTTIPTNTPIPPAVLVDGWESASVSTVCLDIVQIYTDVKEGFSIQAVDDTASRLLGRMGLQAVKPGETCDAKLTIEFTAKSKSSDYGSAGKCYSGATATVQMSFSAEGCPTLNPDPFSVSTGTPYFLYAGCAKEPSGAPFYEIISEGLVRNMLQIWGKPALLAGIVDSDVEVRLETAWITISPEARAAGIETSDMVAILIPAVENDHATTQCWYNAGAAAALALGDLANEEKEFAADIIPILTEALLPLSCKSIEAERALYDLGPDAIDAVPALIEKLRLYLSMNVDENYAQSVASTLTEITGQEFDIDADAWEEWWGSQD
jgi:hypothetical protein